MTASGRHRRHRPGALARTSLTVTAGGAGLALPLAGAAGAAHAAQEPAAEEAGAEEARAGRSAAAEPASAESAAGERSGRAQGERAARARAERERRGSSYEVVSGDSLSSIARAHDVDGGWQGLYEHNRRVVGEDPDLIMPGQRLSIEGARARPRQERHTAEAEAHTAPEKAKPDGGAAPQAKPDRPGQRASPPVTGARTGTAYRTAGSGWSSGYHTGVDFPVPTGTTVRAVTGGSVVSAGWAGAYGYQVVLRHHDGRYSQYAHLSAISVSAGGRVNAGQRLGRSGSTGNSTGPHLHFEVRTGPGYGTDVDPLAYLRGLGVSL